MRQGHRVHRVRVCLFGVSLHSSVFKQHQAVATIVDQTLADYYRFVFIAGRTCVRFSLFSQCQTHQGFPRVWSSGRSECSFITIAPFDPLESKLLLQDSTITNVWMILRVDYPYRIKQIECLLNVLTAHCPSCAQLSSCPLEMDVRALPQW